MKNRYGSILITLLLINIAYAQEVKHRDCTEQNCPPLSIAGNSPAVLPNGKPSPFRGFADACVRMDSESEVLWMTYSYPHIKVTQNANGGVFKRRPQFRIGVETHLASSNDRGITWKFEKVIWAPVPQGDGAGNTGHISHEVPNIIHAAIDGDLVWIGSRLNYFMPDVGGFKKRPPQSFHISVMLATSPESLSEAKAVRLGSKSTENKWRDLDLSSISPELKKYHLWNEPALYYDGKMLYLMLSGMAFQRGQPDPGNSDIVLFSTRPAGDVQDWAWRYVGVVAGKKEAEELGCEKLNQGEIAVSRDGSLLLLVTPSKWDLKLNDFVYQGCRVLQFESLSPPRLRRNADGELLIRASITSSDAGPHGTAASAYDPNSETGIILGKRSKKSAGFTHGEGDESEMTASLHATGIHP